jgi:hypothetical protein
MNLSAKQNNMIDYINGYYEIRYEEEYTADFGVDNAIENVNQHQLNQGIALYKSYQNDLNSKSVAIPKG